ncbi:MAG: hypothetical protein ACOZIN_12105 [Myxococcota bacterium]
MSRIRTDSPIPSPSIELDETEVNEADGRPPRSPEASTNTVEAFRYSSGMTRRATPADPKDAYESIRQALSGWTVNDDDVAQVNAKLRTLSDADFAEVLGRMDRHRLLASFVENAGAGARADFIEQALGRRYLSTSPGQRVTEGSTAANPPHAPDLIRNDPNLPEAVRMLVQDHNAALANGYYAEHRAYIDRYIAAVGAAESAFDIRAMGEPVTAFGLSEPGVTSNDVIGRMLLGNWCRRVSESNKNPGARARKAIDDKVRDLVGERRAGSLRITAGVSVTGKVGLPGVKLSQGASAEVGLTSYGRVEGKTKLGPTKLEIGQGPLSFHQTLDAKPNEGSVGLTSHLGRGKGVDLGAQLSDDGTVRLELKLSQVGGGYSAFNPKTGQFGGGVFVGHTIGDLSVKAQAGYDMQGSNKDRAIEAASSRQTLFAPMPELEAKTPWFELPKARRDSLYRAGIDQGAWEAELRRRELTPLAPSLSQGERE